MQIKTTLFVASILIAAPAMAYDDGQWRANGAAGAGTGTGSQAAGNAQQQQPNSANTTPVAQAVATPAANSNPDAWQKSVTWPAGCQSWANPCPSGAIIAGGGVAAAATNNPANPAITPTAPYSNDFTSYTTQTDSRGVITGMPSVATVAAGVSSSASTTLTTSVRGNLTTTQRSSSTQSGFSQSTSRPAAFGNSASSHNVGFGLALSAMAIVITLL